MKPPAGTLPHEFGRCVHCGWGIPTGGTLFVLPNGNVGHFHVGCYFRYQEATMDETPKTGHAAPRTESEFEDARGIPHLGPLAAIKGVQEYHRLPETIQAVEFRPDSPAIQHLQRTQRVKFHMYPSPSRKEDVFQVWNELHSSWIEVKPGDLIRVDKAPDDVYPIDRDTFEQTYTPGPAHAHGPAPEEDE